MVADYCYMGTQCKNVSLCEAANSHWTHAGPNKTRQADEGRLCLGAKRQCCARSATWVGVALVASADDLVLSDLVVTAWVDYGPHSKNDFLIPARASLGRNDTEGMCKLPTPSWQLGHPAGIEPAASGFARRRSRPLSYGWSGTWSGPAGLATPDQQSGALTDSAIQEEYRPA